MGQSAATAPCPAIPPSHLLPLLLLCRIPGLGILHPSSGFSRARLRRGQRWRPWKAVTVQEGRTAVCGGDPDSQGVPCWRVQKVSRAAFALSLSFSPSPPALLIPPLFPPHIFIGSVIALICMSGKALLHTQEEHPSRGSVAVSALAVVRQCKIKLIKPPTQENITGN